MSARPRACPVQGESRLWMREFAAPPVACRLCGRTPHSDTSRTRDCQRKRTFVVRGPTDGPTPTLALRL
eukprot:scaffold21395_cov113-Isochrysis_galbana.AAC.5